MLTVWKYPVELNDEFVISLPREARPLTVQMQNGIPQMWALLDPDQPREPRRFVILGTGHLVPLAKEELEYVGSFQMSGGMFIWHLFEVKET